MSHSNLFIHPHISFMFIHHGKSIEMETFKTSYFSRHNCDTCVSTYRRALPLFHTHTHVTYTRIHSFSLLSLSLARVPCFSRACSPARALSLILPFSLLLSLSLCRCPILCFFGALPLSLPPFFFPSLAWLVENNTSKDTHSRASGEQYKEGDTQRLSLARA